MYTFHDNIEDKMVAVLSKITTLQLVDETNADSIQSDNDFTGTKCEACSITVRH